MARLSREVIITEKIDGTNAQVFISDLSEWDYDPEQLIFKSNNIGLFAGSRTRWVTPEDDNYGFAKWCQTNAEDLMNLGIGQHFGEWWGQGIQRKYGLLDKRFSLFNVSRWGEDRPACCGVVPTLYKGIFTTEMVDECVNDLRSKGSVAAPGFMKPEGVIVYHTAAGIGFKKTLDKDESPKSLVGLS